MSKIQISVSKNLSNGKRGNKHPAIGSSVSHGLRHTTTPHHYLSIYLNRVDITVPAKNKYMLII